MRYVSLSFLESTLRRGKPLEQFLGGLLRDSERFIRWVELRPAKGRIEIWSFVAPDYGDEGRLDFYEFVGDEDEVLEQSVESPAEAFAFATAKLGALSDRWVNQFVSQDEYLDFIRAGRPSSWPTVGV